MRPKETPVNRARPQPRAEEAIRASGMTYTFLRNNFYADILPFFADSSGVIRAQDL